MYPASNMYYFDLDGVIADWVSAFENLFGMNIDDFNTLSREERHEFKRELGYDFYRNLAVIPEGLALINEVIASAGIDRVAILSAYGDYNTDAVIAAKRDWVAEHVGDVAVHLVPKLEDKVIFAAENAFLIDDRLRAVEAFTAGGGRGVHYDPLNGVY